MITNLSASRRVEGSTNKAEINFARPTGATNGVSAIDDKDYKVGFAWWVNSTEIIMGTTVAGSLVP